jgi:inhibitor of KinA
MAFPDDYRIYAISEFGITIQWNEDSVSLHPNLVTLLHALNTNHFPGFIEATLAYNSISLFFDPVVVARAFNQPAIQAIIAWTKAFLENNSHLVKSDSGRDINIPVCYDIAVAPDLHSVASLHHLSMEEVIAIHIDRQYRVYMIGFIPGFPYLGMVDDKIATPRKESPVPFIKAGSIGLAGNQTGIYPFASPGGWHIIGRTPMKLFDIRADPVCLLAAGDRVRFSRIDLSTFHYLNQYEDS